MEEFVPLDALARLPGWPVGLASAPGRHPGCLPPCAGNRLVHPGRPPHAAARTWCCRRFAWTGRWPDWPSIYQLGVRRFERQFCAPMAKTCASFVSNGVAVSCWPVRCLACRPPASHGLGRYRAGWRVFFDQTHFSRDMRRFTGYSPAQLARLLAEQDPALWPYRFNSMDARRVLGME